MAWLLFFISALILLAAYLSAPEEFTAHASREKPFNGRRPMGRRIPLFRRLRLSNGGNVPVDACTVVVRVDGPSFADRGITEGSSVIARRFPSDLASLAAVELERGDVIIISGPGQFESGLRFRTFDYLNGDTMHFMSDPTGLPNPRPASQLWAKVLFKEAS